MRDVTRIIAGLMIFSVLLGCGNDSLKSNPDYSLLPQNINIPKLGKYDYISTKDLVDKLNNGEKLQLIFMPEMTPEDPADIPSLPGMVPLTLGEVFNYVKKLDKSKPLYLICLYGDDAKKMCTELAKDGWNGFYLDGGSYRLKQDIKQGKVRVNPL